MPIFFHLSDRKKDTRNDHKLNNHLQANESDMSTVNRCYRLRSFPEGKITKDDLELVEEAFPECQGENESADSTDGGAATHLAWHHPVILCALHSI